VSRSLKSPRPRGVVLAVAALVGTGAFLSGQAAPPSAPSAAPRAARPREAAVLAVLDRELDARRSGWFWRSRLVQRPESEGGRVVPDIRPTCGNSMGGNVKAAQALDLAAKLGAAFGAKCPLDVDEKLLPIMDGDTFTPLAAVAVEAVAKLDAACVGEDVDLSLLATGSMDVWPLPKARDASGRVDPSIVPGGGGRFESAKHVRFECRADAPGTGAEKRGRTPEPDGALRSTAGRVALLFVPIYATTDLAGTGMPSFALRVTQGDLAASSSSAMVWLPSSFDAKRPFTVTADLLPGVWSFGSQLLCTAPDR